VRIAYSPRAVTDLADIGDYLSEQNPAAATAVERRIRTIVELIAHFPASGRTLEERPDVRVIPLGSYPYRFFYTVSGGELIILHIRHSSREPVDPGEL
jgi:toxin ParE1/3/4